MAMYLENKIGYPHLKKVWNGITSLSNDDEDEDSISNNKNNLNLSKDNEKNNVKIDSDKNIDQNKNVENNNNNGNDDDDDNDSLDSQEILENDMIWLGTGEREVSNLSLDDQTERDSIDLRQGSESENNHEKRQSYRERISDNMRRRMQYRESVLLQFSGLQEDDSDNQDIKPNDSKGITSPSSISSTLSQEKSQTLQSNNSDIKIQSPSKSPSSESSSPNLTKKSSNISLLIKNKFTNIIQSIRSLFSKTEPIIQWVDIVPVLILSLVIYYLSINQFDRKNHSSDGDKEQQMNDIVQNN